MVGSWLQSCTVLSVYAMNICLAGLDERRSTPSTCNLGFFGPGCQYWDLCHLNCTPQVPSFLRDFNDLTCNPDSQSTSIDVTMTSLQVFRWFRLVVNNPNVQSNFLVKINDYLPCEHQKTLIVDQSTVDVMCDNTNRLLKITLTGEAVKHLCTINISGGRNVALNQYANQTSVHTSGIDRGNPMDVVKDSNNTAQNLCSRTQPEVNPYWQVIYSRQQVINVIKLLTRIDTTASLNNFNLTMFNSTGIVNAFLVQSNQGDSEHYFTSHSFQHTTSIRVTLISGSVLRLCNVWTYGETVCPEGTWGLSCERDCNCSSREICSVVNGVCHQPCARGTYGLKCTLPCLQTCNVGLCLQRTGLCATACNRGKFGTYCSSLCPTNCKNNTCDMTSGECQACAFGFYGTTCNSLCSSSCRNNECDQTSGHCLACDRGHLPYCIECASGFYGATCNSLCPSSCRNSKCDQTSGHCLACDRGHLPNCTECPAGMFGEQCARQCPQTCKGGICNANTGACTACEKGYYGPNCAQPCSTLCAERECHKTSGACLACRSGRVPNCTDEHRLKETEQESDVFLWLILLAIVAPLIILVLMGLYLAMKSARIQQE